MDLFTDVQTAVTPVWYPCAYYANVAAVVMTTGLNSVSHRHSQEEILVHKSHGFSVYLTCIFKCINVTAFFA